MSEPGSGYVVEEWNGDEEYNIIIIFEKANPSNIAYMSASVLFNFVCANFCGGAK